MTTDSNQDGGDDKKDKSASPVDLSELKNLNFGPDWGDSSSGKGRSGSGSRGESGGKRGGKGGPSRDRRPSRPPRSQSGGGDRDRGPARRDFPGGSGPREGGSRGRGGNRREEAPFKPTVSIAFYPEDEPFKVLAKAIRNSYRTYELFEIARLILEKPERFVAVVSPWGGKGDQAAVKTHLFVSTLDGIPFESEEEAISHILANHIEQFFETEEVEVDPPSGNFQFVNRCTLTGELLGPPNYHRYQEFLQHHYANRINNMPMDRYLQKVETVRDEEVVQAWLDKMKKTTRYTEKAPSEGEPKTFESLESARRYLLSQKKDDLVKETDSVRVSGKLIKSIPGGNIRKSIETVWEQQQRFPLDTANHLRGRLRRMKFNIYKKGSKGVSYVCAVKRQFRDPKVPLADSADKLISFIEKHPNIQAAELPEKYLGLEKEEVEVEVPIPVSEQKAEKPAAEAAPAETSEKPEAEVEAPEQESPAAATEEKAEKTSPETPAETAFEEVKEAAPKTRMEKHLRYPDTPELKRLKQDLHWLVSEGYVTEYGDGRLFAPAPQPSQKPKKEKAPTPPPAKEKARDEKSSEAEAPAKAYPGESPEAVEASEEKPAASESKAETDTYAEEPAVEESASDAETPAPPETSEQSEEMTESADESDSPSENSTSDETEKSDGQSGPEDEPEPKAADVRN